MMVLRNSTETIEQERARDEEIEKIEYLKDSIYNLFKIIQESQEEIRKFEDKYDDFILSTKVLDRLNEIYGDLYVNVNIYIDVLLGTDDLSLNDLRIKINDIILDIKKLSDKFVKLNQDQNDDWDGFDIINEHHLIGDDDSVYDKLKSYTDNITAIEFI